MSHLLTFDKLPDTSKLFLLLRKGPTGGFWVELDTSSGDSGAGEKMGYLATCFCWVIWDSRGTLNPFIVKGTPRIGKRSMHMAEVLRNSYPNQRSKRSFVPIREQMVKLASFWWSTRCSWSGSGFLPSPNWTSTWPITLGSITEEVLAVAWTPSITFWEQREPANRRPSERSKNWWVGLPHKVFSLIPNHQPKPPI